MATKKKRVLSAAQKAALAKGRAKMAAKRGRPKMTAAQKRTNAASAAYVDRKSQTKGFKNTAAKTRRRAKRRKQNTEPGYYPNPSKNEFYVGGKNRVSKKIGYFNYTDKLVAKKMSLPFDYYPTAKQVALNLAEQYPQFQFFVETVKKK